MHEELQNNNSLQILVYLFDGRTFELHLNALWNNKVNCFIFISESLSSNTQRERARSTSTNRRKKKETHRMQLSFSDFSRSFVVNKIHCWFFFFCSLDKYENRVGYFATSEKNRTTPTKRNKGAFSVPTQRHTLWLPTKNQQENLRPQYHVGQLMLAGFKTSF